MRILLQRVTSAAVTVDGSTVGAIDHGLVLLVGVGHDDTEADADEADAEIEEAQDEADSALGADADAGSTE